MPMQGDPSYAYLIISPSPYYGSYIQTGDGGISTPDDRDKEKEKEGQYKNALIHFVKIGHQHELADRFAAYNTDNPSIWFRHMEFTESFDADVKFKKLKEHLQNVEKKEGNSSSALFIQKLTLQRKFDQAWKAKEWFIVPGKLKALKDLCESLDDVKKTNKDIKTHNGIVKGEVNVFKSEDHCINFLKWYSDKIFE